MLLGAGPGLVLRVIGLLGMAVWIAVRIVGTVPINSATVDWNLDAPPADWQAQVSRAERFHDIGVLAVIVCFMTFLAGAGMALMAR